MIQRKKTKQSKQPKLPKLPIFRTCASLASVHEFFPRVDSFLLFIPLRLGCMIIGALCSVFCYWHQDMLGSRNYHDSSKKETIGTWQAVLLASDIILALLGAFLIVGAIWRIRLLASLWIVGALQNACCLLTFEYYASPLHYQEKISKEAFKAWPYTLYYCTLPFVELYCIYVVNSYYVVCPCKPKKPPVCDIPMTDFK